MSAAVPDSKLSEQPPAPEVATEQPTEATGEEAKEESDPALAEDVVHSEYPATALLQVTNSSSPCGHSSPGPYQL